MRSAASARCATCSARFEAQIFQQRLPGAALPPRINQVPAAPGRSRKTGQESAIVHRQPQKCRQAVMVAGRVVSRVVRPEQAPVARYVGGDHRHADGEGFRHHVGTSFHARADHHHMAAGQQAQRRPVRLLTDPAITPIVQHAAPRFVRHCLRQRLAGMQQFDVFRVNRSQGRRGAKGILLLAQVAQHADAELALGRGRHERGRDGLVNDARLAPLLRGQFVEGFFLQHDQACGHVERCGRLCDFADVPVEVGAGQSQQGRSVRVACAEVTQGCMALARVQGDQQIAGLAAPMRHDADATAKFTQDPRPARRRVAIAGTRSRRCGGDDDDIGRSHGVFGRSPCHYTVERP